MTVPRWFYTTLVLYHAGFTGWTNHANTPALTRAERIFSWPATLPDQLTADSARSWDSFPKRGNVRQGYAYQMHFQIHSDLFTYPNQRYPQPPIGVIAG
jgi:hypothetical protein